MRFTVTSGYFCLSMTYKNSYEDANKGLKRESNRKIISDFLRMFFNLSEVTAIAVGDSALEHQGKSVLTASSV